MTWRTHVLGGVASLWLLSPIPQALSNNSNSVGGNLGLLSFLAALGALLPDLDAHDSKLRHLDVLGAAGDFEPFVLPGHFLSRLLSHRGLLHSALGIGICAIALALPLGVLLGWQLGVALLLGYTSHIALDACTRTGVPLLYPNPQKWWVLPKSWRIITGSPAEDLVLAPLALLVFALLLRSLLSLYQTGL